MLGPGEGGARSNWMVALHRTGPDPVRYGIAEPPCGRSSMVEPQPSKLVMRVRFPSPAPITAGQRPVPHHFAMSLSFLSAPRATHMPHRVFLMGHGFRVSMS
jgi:hypothetical protein